MNDIGSAFRSEIRVAHQSKCLAPECHRHTNIMNLQLLLWTSAVWQPLLALSIPQHNAQSPILPAFDHSASPRFPRVILAFSTSGKDEVQYIEVPLNEQQPAGTTSAETVMSSLN